ncbi:MAG: DUF898 domain-containing protein [Campylobacteraceae bacterium]|nr:DUF898 domain-containing protein [Campylobacteraceae bacterium]
MEDIRADVAKIDDTQEERIFEFNFSGNANEYFKIWIVNTLLSIITLGIYSPWAKVRNNTYLYSNTHLNEDNFEYTADPIRILIGRLIVVGFYGIYLFIGNVLGMVTLASLFLLVIFLMLPWLIRQAVIFRMRYTRYRGIHFSHRASLFEYYKFFFLHVILNIITFSLAMPYSMKEFKKLIINNTYYGESVFEFDARTSTFYKMYLKYIGAGFLALVIGSVLIMAIMGTSVESIGKDAVGLIFILMPIFYILFTFVVMFLKGLWDAWMANIIYNNTTLDELELKSQWSGGSLGWLYVKNLFLIMVSFGLLYPYTKIRTLKYKLEHTSVQGEDLDNFISKTTQETEAIGEESAEFFDFDIGI